MGAWWRSIIGQITLGIAVLAGGQVCAQGGPGPSEAPRVDFEREVRPILARRCFDCHGEREQHANLRLDRREFAMKGGDSGRKVIEVAAGENELLKRVTNEDVEVRMPLEGGPLSSDELTVIRRWAEQGAPWPAVKVPSAAIARQNAQAKPPSESDPWYLPLANWLEPVAAFVDPYLADYGSFIVAAFGLLLVVGLIERGRSAALQAVAEGGDAPAVAEWCARVPQALYVLGLALLLGWGFYLHGLVRDRAEAKLAKEIQELRSQNAMLQRQHAPDPARMYLPPRPMHPKRLGGEYYRGNDERSDRLFNGGFYRTATFQLALCAADKRQLHIGDSLPPGNLFLKLEIERAKNATPALFTKGLMAATFLSRHPGETEVVGLREEVVRLTAVTEGERWVAYYPLVLPPAAYQENAALAGNVTLYNGPLSETKITARPHFGIVYDLQFAGGKIAEGSDLYMGSLYYWWPLLEHPTPGKVPLHEWFDFRPIPEIEGEHTTDPKLLGVPEHQKGASPAPDQAPASRTESPR